MSIKTATVQITWPRDESAFFRSVVDAAANAPGFRGVQAAALHQPFHQPAIDFYRKNRVVQPGQSVKLKISYTPGGTATIATDTGAAPVEPKPQARIPVAAAADPWGELLVGFLEQSRATGADVDFVVEPSQLDLRLFKATFGSQSFSGAPPSARKAVTNLMALLKVAQNAPNPKVYTAHFTVSGSEWGLKSIQLLAEVQPVPEDQREIYDVGWIGEDEGAAVIADIHNSRRLVLDTAALLIAEQDPTRLDNILMSIAPFAVLKVGKLAKFARLSKAAILKRIRVPKAVPLIRGRYHVDVTPNTALLERALELRKTKYGVEMDDFRRNLTVWDVTVDGKRQFLDAGNVPTSQLNARHGKGDVDVGFHSEGIVAEQIRELKAQGKEVRVHQIYTERMCCGNCRSIIDIDKSLTNVPVFHSVGEVKGQRAAAVMEAYGIAP